MADAIFATHCGPVVDSDLETTSKYSGKSRVACIGALVATAPETGDFKG